MSDRKDHWENVYQNKSPREVSWYQKEPTRSLSLISAISLARCAPIIDIGGGASTLVDKLCEDAYTNISVLDVSKSALNLARKRLADKAGSIHWYEEDVTRFKPTHQFALWHDRAVFHFLTRKTDRKKYIDVLRQSLEPGGHLVMMTFAIDGPRKCSGLDIVQYDDDRLTSELGEGFDLLETGRECHVTPAGHQQEFAFFHYQFKEAIT